MGASSFEITVIGKYTPHEAYRKALEDAESDAQADADAEGEEYDEGDMEAYSGTIISKPTYKIKSFDCPSRKDPYKLADELILNEDSAINNKYGPTGCIEIKGALLKRKKDRKGLKGKKNIRGFIFFGWAPS